MDLKNRTDVYLKYGLKINDEENDLSQEIFDWIPNEIIDFHTHVMPSWCIRPLSEILDHHMASTFLYADAKIHHQLRKIFFPEKKIWQVAFALPFSNFDLVTANQYLLELFVKDRSFIPFWTGTAENLSSYQKDTENHHFFGVKLYPIPGIKSLEISYPDFLLSELDKSGLPLMMHLPTFLSNQINEVETVVQRFPNLHLILAHMGTEKFYSDRLYKAYKILSKYEHVYVDTSMVYEPKIFKAALETFGSERMLFATDSPLHILRVQPVIHPNLGQRYMTDFNYHWVDVDEQSYYRANYSFNCISAGWKMMIALKSAIEDLYINNEEIKMRIFYQNAQKLLFN